VSRPAFTLSLLGTNYQAGDNWKNFKYNFGAKPKPYPASPELAQRAYNGASVGKGHLAEAKAVHPPKIDFDAKKLALFYVSLFQGSSLMAKSSASNSVLVDNIEQFRAYLKSLFGLSDGKTAVKGGAATGA